MRIAPAKLLPLVAADGPLSSALDVAWRDLEPALSARLNLEPRAAEKLPQDALKALRDWTAAHAAGDPLRPPLHAWLMRLRQDLSLEGLVQTLAQLERAVRRAAWNLGLPAPDWQAFGEHVGDFFGALYDEAADGWQGLQAQNQQLRDELAYFHRLAAALETGRDLEEHLRLAVRETARLLQCEFCAVLLPTQGDRDVLTIRAAVAPKILSRALEGMAFPLSENGLIAQVFMTGAPASTYQALDDLEVTLRRRQTLESLGFSQLLAYPLQVHGRVLGVLCLANRLDDQPWQMLEEEWLGTVAGQLAASVRLSQLFGRAEAGEQELVQLLEAMLMRRDPRQGIHGAAVGALAREMGAMLGIEGARLESLAFAGRLHDLGQIFWPDALRLRAGPLWPEDETLVEAHPVDGAALLAEVPSLEGLVVGVRHHHERWDGGGYPEGLRGTAIPLEARIIGCAEAFVTLTTPQVYRAPVAVLDALAAIRRDAGSHFDPLVVQALVQVRGEGSAEPPVLGAIPATNAPRVHAGSQGAEAESPLAAHAPRLTNLLNDLGAAQGDERFFQAFWRTLASEVDYDAAAIWRLEGGVRLTLTETRGWHAAPDALKAEEQSLESYVAACRVPVAVADWASEPRFLEPAGSAGEDFVSACAFPLLAGERVLGVLTLHRRHRAPFSGGEQAVTELAVALLAQAMTQQGWRLRLADALDLDPLTSAVTARAFSMRVSQALARAGKFDLGLAACLVDLDDFDGFNETQGQAMGDEALTQVADLLRAAVRTSDVVARLGGDTFAVLMPEISPAEALTTGEAMRRAIAEARFPGRQAGGGRLTAGIGFTAHRGSGLTRKALLADMRIALAKAKAEGSGQLVFHARAEAER